MPSENEIRDAIVEHIKAKTASFTPPPAVEGRDLAGIFDDGAINDFRDSAKKIHVWIVAQNGAMPVKENRQGGAEYELMYDVWQITEYRSGSEASNSIKEASAERDAVIDGFRFASALPAKLKQAKPIEFPQGSINLPEPALVGQVRISKGILRVRSVYGC